MAKGGNKKKGGGGGGKKPGGGNKQGGRRGEAQQRGNSSETSAQNAEVIANLQEAFPQLEEEIIQIIVSECTDSSDSIDFDKALATLSELCESQPGPPNVQSSSLAGSSRAHDDEDDSEDEDEDEDLRLAMQLSLQESRSAASYATSSSVGASSSSSLAAASHQPIADATPSTANSFPPDDDGDWQVQERKSKGKQERKEARAVPETSGPKRGYMPTLDQRTGGKYRQWWPPAQVLLASPPWGRPRVSSDTSLESLMGDLLPSTSAGSSSGPCERPLRAEKRAAAPVSAPPPVTASGSHTTKAEPPAALPAYLHQAGNKPAHASAGSQSPQKKPAAKGTGGKKKGKAKEGVEYGPVHDGKAKGKVKEGVEYGPVSDDSDDDSFALEFLRSMVDGFDGIDDDIIREVLRLKNGSMDQAVDMLMQLAGMSESLPPSPTSKSSGGIRMQDPFGAGAAASSSDSDSEPEPPTAQAASSSAGAAPAPSLWRPWTFLRGASSSSAPDPPPPAPAPPPPPAHPPPAYAAEPAKPRVSSSDKGKGRMVEEGHGGKEKAASKGKEKAAEQPGESKQQLEQRMREHMRTLQGHFPGVEAIQLEHALAVQGGDLDATLAMLLDCMDSDGEDEDPGHAPPRHSAAKAAGSALDPHAGWYVDEDEDAGADLAVLAVNRMKAQERKAGERDRFMAMYGAGVADDAPEDPPHRTGDEAVPSTTSWGWNQPMDHGQNWYRGTGSRQQAAERQYQENQQLYTKHRQEAAKLAEEMRAMQRAAAEAFQAGNLSQANVCKKKAQELGKQVQEMNRRGGKKIFREKNRQLENTFKVELHGLHVDEALSRVDQIITVLMQLPTKKTLDIITGRGRHSTDNMPKILPALHTYLRGRGLAFFQPNPGKIMVRLEDERTSMSEGERASISDDEGM